MPISNYHGVAFGEYTKILHPSHNCNTKIFIRSLIARTAPLQAIPYIERFESGQAEEV